MLLGPLLVKSCALPEAVVWRCSIKDRALNDFNRKHLRRSLFLIRLQAEDLKLLKRDFSTGLFLCTFQNTSWCELLDNLLLLVGIISLCCCYRCCHIKFLIKSLLTPLGRRKVVFTLSVAIFQNVCLRFTWIWFVDNFFLKNPPRKLKIQNVFLQSFSKAAIAHPQFWNQRGNFNWMENDVNRVAFPCSLLRTC